MLSTTRERVVSGIFCVGLLGFLDMEHMKVIQAWTLYNVRQIDAVLRIRLGSDAFSRCCVTS